MRIYYDAEGDLWSRGNREEGSGAFWAPAPDYRWQGPTSNTLGDVEAVYGPMKELQAPDPLLAVALDDLGRLIDYLAGRRADY